MPTSDRPLPNSVCVLGLGLIGGSLLRAADPLLPAYGWAPSESTRVAAAADGFAVLPNLDDALDRVMAEDGLVVLAAPLPAFATLLPRIAARAPRVRLTDVGSVKAVVADQVADLAPDARYVGSHPMTGTTASGWTAGTAQLFTDAPWVTGLDDASPLDVWAEIAGLALSIGAHVVPAEVAAHDAAVARISHLPHLLALALAQVGAAGGDLALALAAGSFGSGTRVAATRPELIRAMCEANAAAVVDALDETLAELGVARASLASSGALGRLADAGRDARRRFDQRGNSLLPVTLTGDDLIDQLLAVGLAGGLVSDVTRDGDGYRVTAAYPEAD